LLDKEVFLKYRFKRWYFHSLYWELINHPPEGFKIKYEKNSLTNESIHNLDSKSANPLVKEMLFHLKPIPYLMIQRIKQYEPKNCDLIYASQHVLFNAKKPWVTDFEFASALAAYGNISTVKNIIKKNLEHNQCKFILPWSNWAKETLLNSIDCKNLHEKIQVVNYTVQSKKFQKKSHDGINILFVGSSNPMNVRNIQFKNLKEIILAFNEIYKKYDNVNLILKSYLSPELFTLASKNSHIKIINKFLDKEQLNKIYTDADIFVNPLHETLGISLLDAMSFELPVITTNIYEIPEAITHMKNGLLIEPSPKMKYYTETKSPYDYSIKFVKGMNQVSEYMIENIKKNMIMLIEDKSLRKKLGSEARNTIEKGNFSIEKRNEKLKNIFESSMKK
jgi:glycosyltransferase involved in cell wall biosynthesis